MKCKKQLASWQYPLIGWVYLGVEYCEYSTCELCGTSINWVHALQHFESGWEVAVGCICAERLTDQNSRMYEAKAKKEHRKKLSEEKRKLKSRSKRKDLYTKSFKLTENGNYFSKKFQVLVFNRHNSWNLKIGEKWVNSRLPSYQEAVDSSFDAVDFI